MKGRLFGLTYRKFKLNGQGLKKYRDIITVQYICGTYVHQKMYSLKKLPKWGKLYYRKNLNSTAEYLNCKKRERMVSKEQVYITVFVKIHFYKCNN